MSNKVLQNQHYLWECLQRIFPHQSLEVNARNIESNIRGWLELDLGLPGLDLGFEFQDEYHYITTWYYQQGIATVQARDKTKSELIRKKGKTLVTIPCWWDGSIESLHATILFERPDLAQRAIAFHEPIRLNPSSFIFDTMGIPGVGELMLAGFPHPSYSIFRQTITDTDSWWMGEKYDGVRCCWNPKHRTVFSRRGLIIHTPRRYLRLFPSKCIEGEFWFGRSSSDAFLVMRDLGPDWHYCRIPVFDTPLPQPAHAPFEERYATLLDVLKRRHPFLVIAVRMLIRSGRQLSTFTKMLLSDGGEGAILRKCQSLYERGRSSCLVKIKAHGRDIEAIVTGSDKNRLKIELPNGISLKVPSSNVELRTYPKKGDIVMIAYDRLSKWGVPVEPKVVRIRTDLSWEEVVMNHNSDNPKHRALPGYISLKPSATKYFEADQRRIRKFFEDFARRRGLSPLNPETWYPINTKHIRVDEGGGNLLAKLGWNLPEILKNVFPEVKFQRARFEIRTRWPTIEKRREYMMQVAQERGFDPLVPDNWYSFKPNDMGHEGYFSILRVYRFNMTRAMMDIFPDVKFDLSKFPSIQKGYWLQYENRRKYFMEYANAIGFDPLVAENWYRCDPSTFDRKIYSVIRLYDKSLPLTIQATFPDVNMDVQKFDCSLPGGYWRMQENRRRFFVDYAKEQNFDPLVPSNWMHVRKTHVKTAKGGWALLQVTGDNLHRALQAAFPNLHFEKNWFVLSTEDDHWKSRKNRKEFFEEFARRKNFDPNDYSNWYNLRVKDIKDGIGRHTGIVRYYHGSLRTALLDIFPGLDPSLLQFRAK